MYWRCQAPYPRHENGHGPFGETLRSTGLRASRCKWKFATKYADPESGWLYYGYRYYSTSIGQWLSRDPIEEEGGEKLYNYCGNDSIGGVDVVGLRARWQLVEVANQLGVTNPETMDHTELVKAIQKILTPSLKNPDGDWTDFGKTEKKYQAWAKAQNKTAVQFRDKVDWATVYQSVINNKKLIGNCADKLTDDDWKRIVAIAYLESGGMDRYASRWSYGDNNGYSTASGLFQFTKATVAQIKKKVTEFQVTITGLDKVADDPLKQEKTDPIWETETNVKMALVHMRYLLDQQHKCCDLKTLTEWSVVKSQWQNIEMVIKGR